MIKSLIASVVFNVALGFVVFTLSVKVGSLSTELETSEKLAEKNEKLFNDEHIANQANRLIIYELNKELTDVKTGITRSRTGTVTIGK